MPLHQHQPNSGNSNSSASSSPIPVAVSAVPTPPNAAPTAAVATAAPATAIPAASSPPTPLQERSVQLMQQLQYYFSQENLARDSFLRRLMDSAGFVPAYRIVDFNRMRQLGVSGDELMQVAATLCTHFLDVNVHTQALRPKDHWEQWIAPHQPTAQQSQQQPAPPS
jgi:la-related protein 1